jgi:mono/diheme cytochrome c family protein
MKLGPGVVANTCVKCHNDDKASGDLSFEQPLTNEQKLKALANASNGTMPPKGEDLAPEQVRELAVELFGEEQGNQLSDVLNPPSQ